MFTTINLKTKIIGQFFSNYARMKSKVILYAKKFEGKVTTSNFQLTEEETLGEVQNGEFLAEAMFISVDPYTRSMALRFPEGTTMIGRQVARYVLSDKYL